MSEMTRDLRRYTRQTNTRLMIGFMSLLVVVGLGLVYLMWGPAAALSGLICIGLALFPALLIWLLLWIFGWLAGRLQSK
jgi:F0F1-type ATP synthase assembly protein I